MNVLVLAYLGDAIYEFYIRRYLISRGIVKVNELQNRAIDYVSAKNQAKFLNLLMQNNFLAEDEIDIVKKARNHKSRSNKSTDILTYKHATALEALIGYLYYQDNIPRIDEIMHFIMED